MLKIIKQQKRFASTNTRVISRDPDPENLKLFFGPRNFKGLYKQNPLASTPNHKSYNKNLNYITNYRSLRDRLFNGHIKSYQFVQSSKREKADLSKREKDGSRKPFPFNDYCFTNRMLTDELKNRIVSEYQAGSSAQKISFNHGISVPRVEAVIKLNEIEQQWGLEKRISQDLQRMDTMISKMFDKIDVQGGGADAQNIDNLSEIPALSETRHQRFLTIAESEPFGPLDAAKVLDIEPANELLKKVFSEEAEGINEKENEKVKKSGSVFFAPILEGEQTRFRFTAARVGKVGHRYGASRDDTKHGRKIKFTAEGRMMYA